MGCCYWFKTEWFQFFKGRVATLLVAYWSFNILFQLSKMLHIQCVVVKSSISFTHVFLSHENVEFMRNLQKVFRNGSTTAALSWACVHAYALSCLPVNYLSTWTLKSALRGQKMNYQDSMVYYCPLPLPDTGEVAANQHNPSRPHHQRTEEKGLRGKRVLFHSAVCFKHPS